MHIGRLKLTRKAWFIFEMSWITGSRGNFWTKVRMQFVLSQKMILKTENSIVHMMLVISGKSLHRGTGFAQALYRLCTGFAQRWGMRSYLSALTIIRCIHCWSLWCILQWNLQCTVEIFFHPMVGWSVECMSPLRSSLALHVDQSQYLDNLNQSQYTDKE